MGRKWNKYIDEKKNVFEFLINLLIINMEDK